MKILELDERSLDSSQDNLYWLHRLTHERKKRLRKYTFAKSEPSLSDVHSQRAVPGYTFKFNPYHDERGRFASAGRAVAIAEGGIPFDMPAPSAGIQAKLDALPADAGTPAEKRRLLKSMRDDYESDPDFRLLADTTSLYTQGSFSDIRKMSAVLVEKGKIESTDVRQAADGKGVRPGDPMGKYKMLDGRNPETRALLRGAEGERGVSLMVGALRNSPVREETLYRGIPLYSTRSMEIGQRVDLFPKIVVGQKMEIHELTSFTANRVEGERFAADTARGQGVGKRPPHHTQLLLEVRGKTKGLHADAFSTWRQSEVVTNGRFKVLEVNRRKSSSEGTRYEQMHVVLEQEGTF